MNTSDTTSQAHPRDLSAPPSTRPGLARLTRVEVRKLVDTRSGFWLLAVIALGLTAVVAGTLIKDRSDLGDFFPMSMAPTAYLLPILGILTVTTEWSQRTALTTFTLVPERHRTAIAKIAAGLIFSLAAVVTGLLAAVIGNRLGAVLHRGSSAWDLSATMMAEVTLFQLCSVLLGLAFGLLLLNTPAAIVLYFVLPYGFEVLTNSPVIMHAIGWLDFNSALNPLTDGTMHGQGWAKLATAALIWIVIPLALGLTRLVKQEVK
jgi:ABC-2 type transport system permease protein